MKICTKCGEAKNQSEFFVRDKRIGRLHAQCKICYQIHRMNYYNLHYAKYREQYLSRAKVRNKRLRNEYRSKLSDYLVGRKCADCGEGDSRVLEFDHLNAKDKLFTISQAVRLGYKWEEVLAEIEKCRILCANCHKKRTAKQFNWYKNK